MALNDEVVFCDTGVIWLELRLGLYVSVLIFGSTRVISDAHFPAFQLLLLLLLSGAITIALQC